MKTIEFNICIIFDTKISKVFILWFTSVFSSMFCKTASSLSFVNPLNVNFDQFQTTSPQNVVLFSGKLCRTSSSAANLLRLSAGGLRRCVLQLLPLLTRHFSSTLKQSLWFYLPHLSFILFHRGTMFRWSSVLNMKIWKLSKTDRFLTLKMNDFFKECISPAFL